MIGSTSSLLILFVLIFVTVIAVKNRGNFGIKDRKSLISPVCFVLVTLINLISMGTGLMQSSVAATVIMALNLLLFFIGLHNLKYMLPKKKSD